MNYRNMFPKEYLAAEDLNGREVTLTIAKIGQEGIRSDNGTEQKWCLYFQEMLERVKRDRTAINKRLVLNITNARTIAKLYGPETDEWIGNRITLYPTTCMAFGEEQGCIRIRDRVPRQRQQDQAPPPASDQPSTGRGETPAPAEEASR